MSDRRPRGTVVNAEPNPAEVEDLLRAAQDDLLLRLSVDTHTTSSSSLDPDLSRRFDALRGAPSGAFKRDLPAAATPNCRDGGSAPTSVPAADGTSGDGDEVSKILGEDLASRFAALKGSSISRLPPDNAAQVPERVSKEDDDEDDSDGSDGGVSKKEVEKLMQWAMDAARLDPDLSDSDEELVGKGEEGRRGGESDQEGEEDAARAGKQKKAEDRKKPPSSRKWFFF